jgi:cell division protein FtsQ
LSRRPTSRNATRRGAAPKKRKANSRRPKRPGLLDQAVAALPFSQATLTRIATWSIVGTVGAVALGVAAWLGLPAMAGVAVADVVGEAGLKVDEIQIDGLKRMDRDTVFRQALDQTSLAMPLVDIAAVRERLLKYPWVKDARVSRRLPNTLRIFIIEREPAAIWQSHGQLMLVDPAGVPLEPVSTDAMPDLPLLIGDGANAQEPARRKLLDGSPALRPLVKAATWVGNRRWDLTFGSGEKLQLPEGEEEAAKSLRKFAELDAAQGLLRKGTIRFDMRVPGNMVMQRPSGQTATTSVETGE